MNYRHYFHAGNFVDVMKHVTLVALIHSFTRKEKPFCYIDTHAGTGYYDLFSESAQKSKEYLGGIEKVIQADNPPPLIMRYLNCVHHINNKLLGASYAALQYYPGSPLIARYFLRSHDHIIACELHPEDYQSLRQAFVGDKQVAVHHTDGFLGLKAFLPPKERRGLILIDPPYEDPNEFIHIAHSLIPALKRFNTGTFAIWYPLKEKTRIEHFYRTLRQTVSNEILIIELTTYPDLPNHLNGCGMAIVNPPWQLDESIKDVLPWLWKALTINQQGEYRTFFLK
jgi:23S rRNA (adenine2030-N6)-methyltransferase